MAELKDKETAQDPKMVTLTIDGQEVTAPLGMTVIEAASKLDVDIPHYCYHPGLSVAGNCRICIVELVGARGNPLQIACNTPVAQDMVVLTQSDLVKKRRADVLEFLLVNHPLDCPICDQAGECKLQTYYMEHDQQKSRLDVSKVEKRKVIPVGPRVMLDQERCILCTRCVRFLDEVTGTSELCVIHRGDHSELTTFPGHDVENNYSENIVDICPVGALTSRNFRFQARAWFLRGVDTVCPKCATGCNVRVDYYHHEVVNFNNGKAYRLVPRENHDVNGFWMCDEGRLAPTDVNDDRAHTPVIRETSEAEPGQATMKEALNAAIQWIKGAKDSGETVAGLASPDCTLEEMFLFRRLMKDVLGSDLFSLESMRESGKSDEFLMHAEKHPNGKGAALLGKGKKVSEVLDGCKSGKVKVLVILQNHLKDEKPDDPAIDQALQGVQKLIVISTKYNRTSLLSDVLLPSVSFIEKGGTLINAKGRVQRLHPGPAPYGRARPDLEILGALIEGLGGKVESTEPAKVFVELTKEVTALSGLTYEDLGSVGVMTGGDA